MEAPRRSFVRTLLLSTAWMSGVSGMRRLHLSAELIPSAEGNQGLLSIQPNDYPARNQSGGSIRLGFNPIRSNHQPDGTLHPLLINRLEDGSLKAMSAECPHGSCAVRTFSPGSQAHVCPCHASRFRLDGSRISGPSPFGLETYASEEQADGSLHVLVPRLRFTLTTQVVDLGQSQRLKLTFAARRKVTYEVVRRRQISDPWERVVFAQSEQGALSQTEFDGEGLLASVFVEAPDHQGLFAARILAKEY
ncbi:MAG: Rieske (2Fe-2S) protein [Limisphaerales bacterium]